MPQQGENWFVFAAAEGPAEGQMCTKTDPRVPFSGLTFKLNYAVALLSNHAANKCIVRFPSYRPKVRRTFSRPNFAFAVISPIEFFDGVVANLNHVTGESKPNH
jgi:hypothetical protein